MIASSNCVGAVERNPRAHADMGGNRGPEQRAAERALDPEPSQIDRGERTIHQHRGPPAIASGSDCGPGQARNPQGDEGHPQDAACG